MMFADFGDDPYNKEDFLGRIWWFLISIGSSIVIMNVILSIFVAAWEKADSQEEDFFYLDLNFGIVEMERRMFWNVNKKNVVHLIYAKYQDN